jgi:5'(3')-deoxyribonucleotidase
MKLFALIDIDDTICDTVPVWIRKYNKKYKDHLKVKNIQEWDLAQYTVPECGIKIYDILEQGNLYKFTKPIPLALDGINALRSLDFEIAYITAGSPKASVNKYRWLKDHNFWNIKDHYVQTHSKHLIKGDLMIDDNYNNIINFSGKGLLFNQPWNLKYTYGNRINGWKPIIDDIHKYTEERNAKSK